MTIPETPETRGEAYLNAIATGDAVGIPAVPVSRMEAYLNAIATGDASGIPGYPETRIEAYLDAIANGGGGGGSAWELIGEAEYEVSTTSTSQETAGTINLDVEELTENDILWVHIRDKAGKRNGHFYGTETYALAYRNSAGIVDTAYPNYWTIRYVNNAFIAKNNGFGLFAQFYKPVEKTIQIDARYSSSSSGTIDGTYKVEVYKLTPPFTLYE